MKENRKVRVTFDLDFKTGEYEMKFNNITNPGEDMDYTDIMSFLHQILTQSHKKVQNSGIESTENVKKMIH